MADLLGWLNGSLFDWINESSGHTPLIDLPMEWAAQYGVYLVALVLVGIWLFSRQLSCTGYDMRTIAVEAGLAAVLSLSVALLIQHFYVHPRSFMQRGDVHLLLPHGADASFPSEHVALAAGVEGALIWSRHPLAPAMFNSSCWSSCQALSFAYI